MAAVFTCLSFSFRCIKLWAATGGLADKGPPGPPVCVCVRGGVGVAGWAMDVQSIMAALGSGEGEVVSEESALFEYSRSIIRTRAARRLSGCRRRPEQLPPLGREQCADQEEKKKKKKDVWGLVDLSELYHLGDLRDQRYQREGLESGSMLLRRIWNRMKSEHSAVWKWGKSPNEGSEVIKQMSLMEWKNTGGWSIKREDGMLTCMRGFTVGNGLLLIRGIRLTSKKTKHSRNTSAGFVV